ncbi:MAG: hypothetical protein F6J87_14745 [Spirulina sp. SIO3F2]|nr:hypothetical protein [Spirulina sp. SIO3F2]
MKQEADNIASIEAKPAKGNSTKWVIKWAEEYGEEDLSQGKTSSKSTWSRTTHSTEPAREVIVKMQAIADYAMSCAQAPIGWRRCLGEDLSVSAVTLNQLLEISAVTINGSICQPNSSETIKLTNLTLEFEGNTALIEQLTKAAMEFMLNKGPLEKLLETTTEMGAELEVVS